MSVKKILAARWGMCYRCSWQGGVLHATYRESAPLFGHFTSHKCLFGHNPDKLLPNAFSFLQKLGSRNVPCCKLDNQFPRGKVFLDNYSGKNDYPSISKNDFILFIILASENTLSSVWSPSSTNVGKLNSFCITATASGIPTESTRQLRLE